MPNTPHIAELIKKGEVGQIKDAMEQSLAPGSQTFEQALYKLYASGQISIEEALANADSATNLHWLINNAGLTPGFGAVAGEAGNASAQSPSDDFNSIKINLNLD